MTTHYNLDFPKDPQREPYWCHKHARTCQPTKEAFKFLRRYSIDTMRRIEQYAALRTNARVIARHVDSRREKYPAIDGVITSPPYVGLIDYHEQHIYAYHLLGLNERRHHEIGSAANGSSQKAKEEYQRDICEVFARIVKSMSRGGYLIVVANDKANLYGKIADMVGAEVEGIVERHVNRRTGRRATDFYESVFIWRKG